MSVVPMSRGIRVLSCHAEYVCRHSGACCTARWPIPIERDRLVMLQAALRDGRLTTVSPAVPFVWPDDAPVESPALVGCEGQDCAFYERDRARCRVHRVLGHDALPLSCRQFPRVTVLDPSGAAVTLSHYCPTAAALLDASAADVRVIHGAPAFPADGEYVGLDAQDALPPLLAPGMLMDWDSWWEWERQAVSHLGRRDLAVDHALAGLERAVERLRTWSPGDGALIDTVKRVADALADEVPTRQRRPGADALLRQVLDAVPEDVRPAGVEHGRSPADHVRRQFLAAHAFANWTAHLGGGLRSWLRSLDAADALLSLGIGVRQADLLLRHLADPRALAARWTEAERS